MLEWSDLRYVLAVDRCRTLTAAARVLKCDQSTVTRRLAALEKALGTRMFDRRAGEYVLSAAGERLRPHLQALEEQALALERAATGHDASPRGTVRITSIETLATYFLAAHVGTFGALFPEIVLEMNIDRRSLDLGRREADVALRIVRPRQLGLVAQRIGELGIALYASHEYLEGRGTPRLGERSAGHIVVASDEESSWMPEERWVAGRLPGATVALRINSWPTRAAAAEAGLGIAPLPCFLAERSPRLRRLGSSRDRTTRELWLLVHRDLQHVARVRALLDFIGDLVRANAPMLAGRERRDQGRSAGGR